MTNTIRVRLRERYSIVRDSHSSSNFTSVSFPGMMVYMETGVTLSDNALPRVVLRAWYSASFSDFHHMSPDSIIGQLTKQSSFDVTPAQAEAWSVQIGLLKSWLKTFSGSVFLEFDIPRMGRRIDAVLLIGPAVFVIEFKVGSRTFDGAAMDQVWDYALDLKNFHKASHSVAVVPVLVATAATTSQQLDLRLDSDSVYRPISVAPQDFLTVIVSVLRSISGSVIDGTQWSTASYHPTPTIVEAARALYAKHSVAAIARHDAGARNLAVTSRRIEELVDQARAKKQKIICFVTGVPGAGKTLVGLNVATRHRSLDEPTHAVFLSGNGPLVQVLREALTRDELARQKLLGHDVRKGKVGESVKAFIQNVHHFRDDALKDLGPPFEHVAIFDEAQRAWNLERTASFMQRKKNRPGFAHSEPEFLISCMNRHDDWAVIVCLVGGGQEINTGEAGISAWLEAISSHFPHWHVYISSSLTDSEFAAGESLNGVLHRPDTHLEDSLHLAVSMRSFRAENVSAFVKALLDCEQTIARDAFTELAHRYPIALTRNLVVAKEWIRSHARGTERYGLVSSSKAQRLKPYAIDVRVDVNPVHWFLNGKEDTRSSYYLEDAATEFQVQGLEVDWACVTWDADLRFNGDNWNFHDFRGDRWINIKNIDNQKYLRNAYRVLLTRARQGMVLFVPEGDRFDPTRLPTHYDNTFSYLARLGIPVLT